MNVGELGLALSFDQLLMLVSTRQVFDTLERAARADIRLRTQFNLQLFCFAFFLKVTPFPFFLDVPKLLAFGRNASPRESSRNRTSASA